MFFASLHASFRLAQIQHTPSKWAAISSNLKMVGDVGAEVLERPSADSGMPLGQSIYLWHR